MINKAQFANIIKELDLKLSPMMLKNYIDINFKFVDRTLQGKLSFGQFLASYANFMYSYEIAQGMRKRRQAQDAQRSSQAQLEPVQASTAVSSSARMDDASDGDVLAGVA